MSKKSTNPFVEYQKQFFDAWTENLEKVPGAEQFSEYQKQFFDAWTEQMEKMPSVPGAEQLSDMQKQFFETWKEQTNNWQEQIKKFPGVEQASEQFAQYQEQFTNYQKQAAEQFAATQKQFFEAWTEQLGKVPGMDSLPNFQNIFKGMMPSSNPTDYWKSFMGGLPGLGDYWKNLSNMMPDPTSFFKTTPYKIPGFDAFSNVYDLWKGANDPVSFARDYADKYMDLMQDIFKGFLPEGSLAFMQRPMDFMDTLVNYYQQNFAPMLKVDEQILQRIASGDLSAYTDFFRSFNEQYEETIGKYYNMMGLGLNRESNEEYMQALSAYNKAMFATGELMSLVMTTGAESMTELVSNIQKMLSEGKSLTTFREFYDLWSSTTEGELMKLLDTDEFAKTFDNFADMYSQYMIANNKVIERALSSLPIPTNSDMKSLYKTVYDLRKDVRDLKREIKDLKNGKKK